MADVVDVAIPLDDSGCGVLWLVVVSLADPNEGT